MTQPYDDVKRETMREMVAQLAEARHEYAAEAYNVECDGLDPVVRQGKAETRVSCDSCRVVLLRVPDTGHTDETGTFTYD